MEKFAPGVREKIGHYVYRLLDPRNGNTFYVGRGQGNRVFAHARDGLKLGENEDTLSMKLDHIRELIRKGMMPIHVVHRHGLSREAAIEVEAALIDCYPGLTNEVAGQGSFERGSATAQEIAIQYAAPVMEPDECHRLLYIKTKASTVARVGLYEAVRGSWKIGERVKESDYIIAVVDKVCSGVFVVDIDGWRQWPDSGRREFHGREAPAEVVERYRGKLIPERYRKGQNPVRYGW